MLQWNTCFPPSYALRFVLFNNRSVLSVSGCSALLNGEVAEFTVDLRFEPAALLWTLKVDSLHGITMVEAGNQLGIV
jgi:hypothetical protein